jgi:hypothetical protein
MEEVPMNGNDIEEAALSACREYIMGNIPVVSSYGRIGETKLAEALTYMQCSLGSPFEIAGISGMPSAVRLTRQFLAGKLGGKVPYGPMPEQWREDPANADPSLDPACFSAICAWAVADAVCGDAMYALAPDGGDVDTRAPMFSSVIGTAVSLY